MRKDRKNNRISTFVGADASFEGNIEFAGTIRVDGRVKGTVTSKDGTVIVGEKAVVEADMVVGAAVIMGRLDGTIDAVERIEVFPPGIVSGDIQAPVISIEPGAVFNGTCIMKKAPEPAIKRLPAVTTGSGGKQ